MLDLYDASFDINDLAGAYDLQKKQSELFWDRERAGYFSATGNDPSVLLRIKEDYDGAEPSPNSVAALNLLRLSEMLDDKTLRDTAVKTIAVFGARVRQAPRAMPQMTVALDFSLVKPKQIVIAGRADAADTRAMLHAVHRDFVPNKILQLADNGEGQVFLGKRLEFIRDVMPLDARSTAYVCEDHVCQLSTTNPTTLVMQLRPRR